LYYLFNDHVSNTLFIYIIQFIYVLQFLTDFHQNYPTYLQLATL